ncbi:hypothetical protein C8Q73DRAFT_704211 [Cubamyces lactineus]|nr:hypothetical protein C8Q73DRAFT_704211 [Cubamyces lactineus]
MWSECHGNIRGHLCAEQSRKQNGHFWRKCDGPYLYQFCMFISLPILHVRQLDQRKPGQPPCSGPLLVALGLGSHFLAIFPALLHHYAHRDVLRHIHTCYVYFWPNRVP